MAWITDNDADDTVREMGGLFFPFDRGKDGALFRTSTAEVKEYENRAQLVIEESLTRREFKDSDLDMSLVEADIQLIREMGLSKALHVKTEKLRFMGGQKDEILAEVNESGYPLKSNLIDLLQNGQRSFMKPDFVPNGGVHYRQSISYRDHRQLSNWHMFQLLEQGRALIIPEELISQEDMARTHFSSNVTALSSKPEGRCCLHGSSVIKHGRKKSWSLNDGTDLKRSDELYPPSELPTVRDICDLAQRMRERYEAQGEELAGATIDVSSAYRQITLSDEAAWHRAVKLYLGDQDGNTKPYVCYSLVACFGDTRAGHAYNVAGGYFDYMHNKDLKGKGEGPRSKTYIDDGIMISSRNVLTQDREQYRPPIRRVLRPDALEERKDKDHGQDLIAIGWHFNLRYDVWRVAPKPKGLDKIYASLFMKLPLNADEPGVEVRMTRAVMIQIASLLTWYGTVLRVGIPFVHSIWKSCGWGAMDHQVILSDECRRDIGWWRLISHASMKDPHFLSAKIDHLVTHRSPEMLVATDASSKIGGGGWLSGEINEQTTRYEAEGFLRWSQEELDAFGAQSQRMVVDINVLEFFCAAYFVILWGDRLKGKIVAVKCDNTAAVSWLLKSRGSNRSPIGESLVKVFVLYCLASDITIMPSHIKGVNNTHADMLSRVQSLQESWDRSLRDTRVDDWWIGLSRKEICRSLLMASIKGQLIQSSQNLLRLVRALL